MLSCVSTVLFIKLSKMPRTSELHAIKFIWVYHVYAKPIFVGLFLTWNFTLCVLRYRWEVLPGIHLGKEGWGLQVPSLHTYSEGGEYSNLNPLWQEIEHCIVVGVLWQVATPLLGSAGLIHFPSATNNTGKSCQSWYRTQESIVHVSFNDNI